MKRSIPFSLALSLLLGSPLLAGSNTQTFHINDEPVPIDGTYVASCVTVEVLQPKTCSATVSTHFEVLDYILKPMANRAVFVVDGAEASSTCTVDFMPGEECYGENSLAFEAVGLYDLCLYVDAFPVEFMGGNWDDLGGGDGPQQAPEGFTSDIHYSAQLVQDCGDIVSDNVND